MHGEGEELSRAFFERDPLNCARDLIGCTFRWRGCSGAIVETEAYAAEGDPACHTFVRPSAREFVARHAAGTAYVYMNYGVHWLFNVLVKGPGGDGFVLFRALEPVEGLAAMRRRRKRRHERDLCSGPGKLTQAMGITHSAHGRPFLEAARTGIVYAPDGKKGRVIATTRIGISSGQDLPWRFVKESSPCLSAAPGR